MSKHKFYLISIAAICLLSGCGNNSIQQTGSEMPAKEQQSSEIQAEEQHSSEMPAEEQHTDTENDNSSFDQYSDSWSNEGNPQEQVLPEDEETAADHSTDNIAVYPTYDPSWTEEELIAAIKERNPYYTASAYYSEIIDYWENVRGVGDITNLMEPLFETDKKYYTKEEFENEPMLVIHLAKNEIYARHGYIFANKDLLNYFMGCLWYSPTCDRADFTDAVFNEYEKANLKLLTGLDTY